MHKLGANKMITGEEIKSRLSETIKLSGKTQTEIANKLNIYQSAVQQYVSGKTMPALDTFANLCVVLDVDPADILGTKSKPKDGN